MDELAGMDWWGGGWASRHRRRAALQQSDSAVPTWLSSTSRGLRYKEALSLDWLCEARQLETKPSDPRR
jgi:hypothetical protein